MARINVDDNIESYPEHRRLVKILNYDEDKALGMLVRFWRLAQKYWAEGLLIPCEEIANWDLQPILESRWGIEKSNGVYAIGSEERFAWYKQRVDAGKQRILGSRDREGKFVKDLEAIGKRNRLDPIQRSRDSHQPLILSPSLAPALIPVKDNKKVIFDFVSVYDLYPRKEGKLEGLILCKSKIVSDKDYRDLLLAVRNYRDYCTREQIEKKFIKQFSTFMAKECWKEWIEWVSTTDKNGKIDWGKVDFGGKNG